jgi:HAD superfamily hydrolase (TIGR01549 family)
MDDEAVLFDNDGVLLEYGMVDKGAFRSIAAQLFQEHRVDPTEDEVAAVTTDIDPDEVRTICERYGIDTETFWREREHRFAEQKYRHWQEGRKGLYDDAETIHEIAASYRVGIVSNNQQHTIDRLVDFFDLEVDTHYGKEPVLEAYDRIKPDTYYIEQALEDLEVSDVLYVGDKAVDVRAANRAGLESVFVIREHNGDQLEKVDPDHTVRSLRELPELLE